MSSWSRAIILKSSEGQSFVIEEAAAQQSEVIKSMIDVDCSKAYIPISKVTGNILSRVIRYCRKHANTANDEDSLKSFDKEFVNVDDLTLIQLTSAAKFLEIKSLVTLTCKTLGDIISNSSVEEIRERFGLKNDLTPEETAGTGWGFDGTPSDGESGSASDETSLSD